MKTPITHEQQIFLNAVHKTDQLAEKIKDLNQELRDLQEKMLEVQQQIHDEILFFNNLKDQIEAKYPQWYDSVFGAADIEQWMIDHG